MGYTHLPNVSQHLRFDFESVAPELLSHLEKLPGSKFEKAMANTIFARSRQICCLLDPQTANNDHARPITDRCSLLFRACRSQEIMETPSAKYAGGRCSCAPPVANSLCYSGRLQFQWSWLSKCMPVSVSVFHPSVPGPAPMYSIIHA